MKNVKIAKYYTVVPQCYMIEIVEGYTSDNAPSVMHARKVLDSLHNFFGKKYRTYKEAAHMCDMVRLHVLKRLASSSERVCAFKVVMYLHRTVNANKSWHSRINPVLGYGSFDKYYLHDFATHRALIWSHRPQCAVPAQASLLNGKVHDCRKHEGVCNARRLRVHITTKNDVLISKQEQRFKIRCSQFRRGNLVP